MPRPGRGRASKNASKRRRGVMKKVIVVLMGLFVAGALVGAPKPKKCNDLKIDRCKERQDCVWVDAFKDKNGKQIKAHCKCKGKCEK
jgi:hypothetical protein